MRMPDELTAAFNRQISMELASSIAYLQMSAYLDTQNLIGMAGWMRAQADEERNHALAFFDFVLSRGNDVEIGSIDAPPSEFSDAAAVFADSLEQERAVTASIHSLYQAANEQGDFASVPFLQAFIEEQREEEETVETILERVKMAADNSSALLLLDSELGTRPTAG